MFLNIPSDIHEYIETNWPTEYISGNWGCQLINYDGVTEAQMLVEYPHGKKAVVANGDYWIWKTKN